MRGNEVGKEESLHKILQERSRKRKEMKQTDTRCRIRKRKNLDSTQFT
jgi:hypothetical protein